MSPHMTPRAYRRKVIRRIERIGKKVVEDQKYKGARDLTNEELQKVLLELARLTRLGKLPSLTLDLTGCKSITDDGLEHLGKLPILTELELAECEITDNGLVHVGKLPSLEKLNLRCCRQITDAGMEHVGKLTSLTWLDVRWCPVTTHHVSKLWRLTTLGVGKDHSLTHSWPRTSLD